ncbi:MAG: paREP15, coiled-coil protein [Thermodesulfovibrionia bacterium]
MDIEKITEGIGTRIKDIIIGELKEELKTFRSEVRGELAGYRLAIESMNQRLINLENDIRDIRNQLIETNKRIDDVRDYLLARIDDTNKRLDDTNKRLDIIHIDLIKRIDETNKRIDETNQRIDKTNQRIGETNQRIDNLYIEIGNIKADLKKALSDKAIINDVLIRIERLETKVA